MADRTDVWTDEKGQKVEIITFFSHLYSDPRLAGLSAEYRVWECDGEFRPHTLGDANFEVAVAIILVLVRAGNGNPPEFYGVEKSELNSVFGNEWLTISLVKDGLLREKWIRGKLVVFPTRKLIEKSKISKR